MLKRHYFIIFLLSICAYANEFCGIIDIPTVWTKEDSPYTVTGDIQISPAARLTIEAGVEINIVPGEACGETKQLDWSDSTNVSIKVLGELMIQGTKDNPVRILPKNYIPGKVQWDGIRLYSKEKNKVQIEFLHIMSANRAIYSRESKFNVGNSTFIGNNTGIWMEKESNLTVYNNLFAENLSAGVYIKDSRPSVVANIFYKNISFGVWADSRPTLNIKYNLFYKNADTDCRFCPVGMAKILADTSSRVPKDKFENIFADPVFSGSEAEQEFIKKDISLPTPKENVKDTVLSKIYTKADSAGKTGVERQSAQNFQIGKWEISKYSPAINAAPNTAFFKNEDGSRGNLGPSGGKLGRHNKEANF